MLNPILNQLSPQLSSLTNLKNMISANPQQIAQNLLNSNPQFKQFYEQNKYKTPEQIASTYGIDYNSILSLLK